MAIDSVVISFGHRARSGKDTAANEIIKQRGLNAPTEDCNAGATCICQDRYDIRKYGFADALKIEVTNLARKAGGMEKLFAPNYCFPKKGYVVTLPEWVTYDPNPDMSDPLLPFGKQRAFLQWYGSDFRRADDDLYWIHQLEQTIELEKPQIAIISDMRFPNEMTWTLQYGEAVRIDRAGLPPSTHISETALADATEWALILENNGSLEEFKEGAITAFDELLCNFPFGANRVAVQGA